MVKGGKMMQRRKSKRLGAGNAAGFTLIELLIVILIVGILAATAVPLYLGYTRDARMAEGKALAGSVLTASQGCAQVNGGATSTECTLAKLSSRVGLSTAGASADGRWDVDVGTVINLDTSTPPKWTGGPISAKGVAGKDTASMTAGITVGTDGTVVTRCNVNSATTITTGDPAC